MNEVRILICDDDPLVHASSLPELERWGRCFSAFSIEEGIRTLQKEDIHLVVLDLMFGSDPDAGFGALSQLRRIQPDLPIIVLTGSADFRSVQRALRLGAIDYVAKDHGLEELIHGIRKALPRISTKPSTSMKPWIGNSNAMIGLMAEIDIARRGNEPVVIQGETGSGKEWVARMIAQASKPFVSIDSSTIHLSTAESVLFGHERGAFTGAEQKRTGLFEQGNGGTVFFDEIGNMQLEVQQKLLRVLQEKEIKRLGSHQPVPLQFRVLCATNQDLASLAVEGTFQKDLWHRLEVFLVEVPPLRKRIEDLDEMIRHFSPSLRLQSKTLGILQRYPWPGNVRELINLIRYLEAVLGESLSTREISPEILPQKYTRPMAHPVWTKNSWEPAPTGAKPFYEAVHRFEHSFLNDALRSSDGNVSQLARSLGMDRSHLYSKLKQLGLSNS